MFCLALPPPAASWRNDPGLERAHTRALNDDRIGRALDAVEPALDAIVGSIGAKAVAASASTCRACTGWPRSRRSGTTPRQSSASPNRPMGISRTADGRRTPVVRLRRRCVELGQRGHGLTVDGPSDLGSRQRAAWTNSAAWTRLGLDGGARGRSRPNRDSRVCADPRVRDCRVVGEGGLELLRLGCCRVGARIVQ